MTGRGEGARISSLGRETGGIAGSGSMQYGNI